MRRLYRHISLILVLTFLGLTLFGMNIGEIQAKSTLKDGMIEEFVIKDKNKSTIDFSVASVYNAHEGTIYGDGVRLRQKPSKTSTVLELMNDGEHVYVYPQITADDGKGKGTYIKRYKTGTTGWVSNDYIIVL